MGLARLLLRAAVGGYFFGHGMQKLAGWFGGGGLDGTAQFFESLGLHPGREQALAAGATEAGGGALLVLGLGTPAAVTGLSAVMVSAIRHVHWRNGPWASKGGYELNLVLLAALATLAEVGPGPLSLDAALGSDRHGTGVALAALGAGAAGSILLTERARRAAPPAAQERAAAAEEPALSS